MEPVPSNQRPQVAVIGAGVAGIVAAYLLQGRYHVSLFEKKRLRRRPYPHVVIDDGPDAGIPVDTGFIVLNDRTYPILNRFFRHLDVAIAKSDMSFFKQLDRLLAPGGIAVLQSITIPDQRYEAYRRSHDWIQKHIFPGGLLPSLTVLTREGEKMPHG